MLLPHRRYMTIHELEELQGFPCGQSRIPAGVTLKAYAGMLGNAFSVPVVGRVALALLKTVGRIKDFSWDLFFSWDFAFFPLRFLDSE